MSPINGSIFYHDAQGFACTMKLHPVRPHENKNKLKDWWLVWCCCCFNSSNDFCVGTGVIWLRCIQQLATAVEND